MLRLWDIERPGTTRRRRKAHPLPPPPPHAAMEKNHSRSLRAQFFTSETECPLFVYFRFFFDLCIIVIVSGTSKDEEGGWAPSTSTKIILNDRLRGAWLCE